MQTNRSNMTALVGGALLIAFGLLTLAGQIFRFLDWSSFWPFIVIGFGALFFVAMVAGGKQTAAFAIPGSIITGIGLMLLVENMMKHWGAMAYSWTLIIMFVGAGIYIMGWYGDNTTQRESGMRVMRVGLILFIIFGALFEMAFSSFNNLVFPILLILLGLYLILSRLGLFGKKKNDSPESIPPAN